MRVCARWGVVLRMHPSKQKLVIYNENSFLSLTRAPASFDSRLDDGVGRGWGDEADSCLSFAQQKSQLQYKKQLFLLTKRAGRVLFVRVSDSHIIGRRRTKRKVSHKKIYSGGPKSVVDPWRAVG